MLAVSDSDGPFGGGGEVGVGFSDAAILVVSLLGFLFLATTVYSLILLRVQSKEEFEKAEEFKLDYDEQLERADVATLTRAQRRQRAQLIMKRNRRIAPLHGAEDAAEELEEHVLDDRGPQLSRKERQKAAKAAERQERKLYEEERREQHKEEMEAVKREKKERERLEAERLEEERQQRLIAKEAQERAELEEFNTFLASHQDGGERMTVAEFDAYAKEEKVIYIDDLADRFHTPSEQVGKRIEELVASSRLTGVIDRGRFVYITHEEMKAIANSILEKKRVTLSEVSKLVDTLVKV